MNHTLPASRFLSIEGGLNFRDFGGYETQDGRIVRRGVLFRSGSLSMIEGVGIRDFERLDIGLICDLRRTDEAERGPAPVHPAFDCRRHIPIAPGSNILLRESLEDRTQTAADRIAIMTQMMRDLVNDHGDDYHTMFEVLLENDRGFLVHCSAGKDRTGLAAILVLTALGVDLETVRNDYLLTNEAVSLRRLMNDRMRENHEGVDDESLDAITGVREEYLAAAMTEVRRGHGSLDNYLSSIGVGSPEREALRARFLT